MDPLSEQLNRIASCVFSVDGEDPTDLAVYPDWFINLYRETVGKGPTPQFLAASFFVYIRTVHPHITPPHAHLLMTKYYEIEKLDEISAAFFMGCSLESMKRHQLIKGYRIAPHLFDLNSEVLVEPNEEDLPAFRDNRWKQFRSLYNKNNSGGF